MDGMGMAPAPRDETAELREQVRTLTAQLLDVQATLAFIAECPDPTGQETWQRRARLFAMWAQRCLVRLQGG